MAVVDIWCNLFTAEVVQSNWFDQPEVSEVLDWWAMRDRVRSRTVPEFVAELDAAGVDAVLIPSARMNSYKTGQLIWDVSDDDVAKAAAQAPGRIYGLVGIDPREGMSGVARLERMVRDGGFVGAHLHAYGFGLPLDHRRFYPYYAKCAELGVPIVVQVGHSAEKMPSEMGRPLLLDNVALDLPELNIVGAHTGWPWVEEMIALAWKHQNVYIGTSAHHPRYWDPALVAFANGRGRGKVLYGTDFPVMEYADSIAAINELELRDRSRALLLGDAAAQLFKLPSAAAPTRGGD